MCTHEKPFVVKSGGSVVKVGLPGADELPEWASQGGIKLILSSRRTVESLEVFMIPNTEKHAIAQSVTGRFGLPEWTNLPAIGVATGATWNTADLEIRLACGPLQNENCSVEFRSRAAADEVKRAAEDRAKARKPL
ncbi:MAG: hypothetical protein ACT6S0_04705 [Roseateles sp.]|uniref:hypothetical protein n=1 Tax=Roseateles sp. TaxID=1971397 RepID=UPI00403713AB